MFENVDDYDVFVQLDDLVVEMLSEDEDWDLNINLHQLENIKDLMLDGKWTVVEA